MDNTFAYIAGIIDGEGSIGVRKYHNSTGQLHYRPVVEVTNTNKKVIDFVTKSFSEIKSFTCWSKRFINKKVIFSWRVTGKNTIPVIKSVMPFLIIKRKQAVNCLKLANRLGSQGQTWADDFRSQENKIREKIYIKAKLLNT